MVWGVGFGMCWKVSLKITVKGLLILKEEPVIYLPLFIFGGGYKSFLGMIPIFPFNLFWYFPPFIIA